MLSHVCFEVNEFANQGTVRNILPPDKQFETPTVWLGRVPKDARPKLTPSLAEKSEGLELES
jgi:hypothetical protein